MLGWKAQSILEPIKSRKWSEIFENFIDQIASIKNDCLANRFSLGKELK